jgi:hypothetical protein
MIIRSSILLTFITSLFACNETAVKSEDSQKKKTYNQFVSEYEKVTPKNDTIALGFILRQPEKDIAKRYAQLMREGKLKEQVDLTFGLVKIPSLYPYSLIIDESTRLETFIGHNTYKGRLASLTFFGEMDSESSFETFKKLLDWMKTKFGEPSFTQTVDSRDEYYGSMAINRYSWSNFLS